MLASPSSPLPATSRFLRGLCLSLALCFGVQAFVYYTLDGGTGKSESNYFSTMSRFQAAAMPPAEIAFAGSSITGRIPGREVGNRTVANLGSDGGPALDGIRLLLEGRIAQPKWLVIEVNTLYGRVGFGDTLIVKGAKGQWFVVGAKWPLLGASARPSAMLYTSLLRRPKILTGEAFAVVAGETSPPDRNQLKQFPPGERSRLIAYQEALRQLQQRGVKIVLVNYPAGQMNEIEKCFMDYTVSVLSQDLGVPYLDLSQQIPRTHLHFTDAVHLAPESAARVLASITEFCNKLDSKPH